MSVIKPLRGRREGQSWIDWLFTNPATGEKVFAQFPNVPLALFIACWIAARLIPNDAVSGGLSIVASLALLWWAGWEALAGDAPWRRIMGIIFSVSIVSSLVSQLGG